MNPLNKKRVIKDFDKLDKEFQKLVKSSVTKGFRKSLISFYDKNGKRVTAFPFETEDTYYLLRIATAASTKSRDTEDIDQKEENDIEQEDEPIEFTDIFEDMEYSDDQVNDDDY